MGSRWKEREITKDSPHLHNLSSSQDRLNRPPRQLRRVVLHLHSRNSSPLGVQLLLPIHGRHSTAASSRRSVEKSLDGNEGVVSSLLDALDNRVDLGPDDHGDSIGSLGGSREVELPVSVTTRGERVGLLSWGVEGVGVSEVDSRGLFGGGLGFRDDLAGEVGVDEGGFKGESGGRVGSVGFRDFGRRVGRVLVDRDVVCERRAARKEEKG